MTSEKPAVPQVLDRLSLRVQELLDSPDDLVAPRQEELEQLDVRLERHLTARA